MNLVHERPHQLKFVVFHAIWHSLDMGSLWFNTQCKSKPRHRHEEEEVGRLWSQCAEVYIVKELHLGIERRCTKVERGVSGIASQLGWRCAATARRVARDPAARKAAQVKVRSKFYAKNVETTKSSKLALAEELATLGGCEPIYRLSEVTLLTFAGALDGAGYRSASSYIAELRLRHVELDCAISPALDRAFKKVNDAVTRGLSPVEKAPEVKLSTIKHDTDTLIADAHVISLHWLLRADETEDQSSRMTSLFLHEGMSGPGDVTLRLPTSETDPRGNGASRRLTCILYVARLCSSPPGFSFVLVVRLGDRR